MSVVSSNRPFSHQAVCLVKAGEALLAQTHGAHTLNSCKMCLLLNMTGVVFPQVASFNSESGVRPQKGRDMWNSNFVKMPSSWSSFATVKTGFPKVCLSEFT